MNENNYTNISSQNEVKSIHIGDRAPLFTANSTLGEISLNDYIGSWIILFSHPGDFTPVCTTEFIAFANMNFEFEKRNCKLIGLSIDSNSSHLAWINNIQNATGITIPFPIIEDKSMNIAKMYSMIAPNVSNTQTVRNVFFIDPNQIIRSILIYPMSNGRNINEILRLLDAMQLSDIENTATPANWMPGFPTILPAPTNYNDLLEKLNNHKSQNCMDWYLCFKESNNLDNLQSIKRKNILINEYNNKI